MSAMGMGRTSSGPPAGGGAKLLVVAVTWLLLVGVAAAAWRFGVSPLLSSRSDLADARADYERAIVEAKAASVEFEAPSGVSSVEDYARAAAELRRRIDGPPELTAEGWASLAPASGLSAPPLAFHPGDDELSATAQRRLKDVAALLRRNPFAYVEVSGGVSGRGDRDINERVARARAQAVVVYLTADLGVKPTRLRATVGGDGDDGGSGDGGRTVSFHFGVAPAE